MGLLDDAIREHLDLKRRRGADPAEVERAEREALGPVRRNRESGEDPAEPGSPEAPAPESTGDPADGFAYDHEAEEHGWEEHEAEVSEPFQAEPLDDDADLAPGQEPESFATAPPARQHPRDLTEGETAEYDVERALSADDQEEEEGDDVLEETPEFLQDTPDHDRLWFEQRPPRDFDFDG